jgi:hypothetical protein
LRWQSPRQLLRIYCLQGPAKEDLTPLRIKQYTPPALIQQTIHTQSGVSYAQITSQNPSTTPTPAPVTSANQPQQQSNDILELEALLKNLFDQMGTLLNLLTTIHRKLK